MRIIIAASQVPPDSQVTKKTGQKLYTLRHRLRIFGDGPTKETLPGEGKVFLVANNGDSNVIPLEEEVVWHEEEASLLHWLNVRESKRSTSDVTAADIADKVKLPDGV